MLNAAIPTAASMDGVRLRDVNLTMATLDHVFRAGWWVGGWMHFIFPLRNFGAAIGSPVPDKHNHHDQQHQVLHVLRPKITSSTKREPTYASSSKAEPPYRMLTALRPRQPNALRPTINTAKVSQARIENTVL